MILITLTNFSINISRYTFASRKYKIIIMKKLLVASAVALFGMVSAQKNTLLVGGNISYNTGKNTINTNVAGTNLNSEDKTDEFSFNPTIGYQFTDNLTAGVRLGVTTTKGTVTVNGMGMTINAEAKENNFSYGIFGRYTMPLSETFAVYGDLDIFAMNGKTTTPSFAGSTITYTESKTNGFGVLFTPNLFINFKNSFGLNFNIGGLGYTHSEIKGMDNKTNQFGFEFGKGVTVGISKNFKL